MKKKISDYAVKAMIFSIMMTSLVASPLFAEQEYVAVKRALDGATLELETGEIVRLIGIDMETFPEGKENHIAVEAKDFLTRFLVGKKVYLEFDPRDEKENHQNSAHELLAYVFLDTKLPASTDVSREEWFEHHIHGDVYSVFVNASSVRAGLIKVSRGEKFKYQDRFIQLENEARLNKRGMWSKT